MIIAIQFILILISAFLLKNARSQKNKENYIFLLLIGIVTFLFIPVIDALLNQSDSNMSIGGGGVQLFADIFGIYCIIFSIRKLIGKKNGK